MLIGLASVILKNNLKSSQEKALVIQNPFLYCHMVISDQKLSISQMEQTSALWFASHMRSKSTKVEFIKTEILR